MLRILDAPLKSEVVSDLCIDRQLVMHEARYLTLKHTARTWPAIDYLIPEPFELQVWILIKHDLHNIANIDTARLQPASRRQCGEAPIVLYAAQPFFMDGKRDLVFVDYGNGAIVIVA